MKHPDKHPIPGNADKPLHFNRDDKILARYMNRYLRGKVLFIYKEKRTASIVIEEGQHPVVYGTYDFYWFDVYKPT